MLPDEVRTELHQRLIHSAFSGYEALSDWLAEQGYQIKKSALHSYGQALEQKLAAVTASTQAAVAIAEAAPDDADLRSAAMISLIQTDTFDVLVKLQNADSETDPEERLKLLAHAARSIADLSRASVSQKKWQEQVRGKVESAAQKIEGIARKSNVTPEDLRRIREEVYGIAG